MRAGDGAELGGASWARKKQMQSTVEEQCLLRLFRTFDVARCATSYSWRMIGVALGVPVQLVI